ncbi:MAG: hypothetical protein V7K43_25515 [Nostoc sp.]
MKILDPKNAINHHKDTINLRQDERLIIVETAIHRVSCLNRTVLGSLSHVRTASPRVGKRFEQ